MKIPCEQCITRAICKNKNYSELLECHYLRDVLYGDKDNGEALVVNRQDGFYSNLLDLDNLFGRNFYDGIVIEQR